MGFLPQWCEKIRIKAGTLLRGGEGIWFQHAQMEDNWGCEWSTNENNCGGNHTKGCLDILEINLLNFRAGTDLLIIQMTSSYTGSLRHSWLLLHLHLFSSLWPPIANMRWITTTKAQQAAMKRKTDVVGSESSWYDSASPVQSNVFPLLMNMCLQAQPHKSKCVSQP